MSCVCENNHLSIRHDEIYCPLCTVLRLLKEKEEAIKKLQKKIDRMCGRIVDSGEYESYGGINKVGD